MAFIKEKLEKVGLYVFFMSLGMFTQISWMKSKDSYDDVEIRLFLAIVLGFTLSALVFGALERALSKKTRSEIEDIMAKISLSLSPGLLFLFAPKNLVFMYLGVGFCVLMILNNFLRSPKYFINILEINGDVAEIKVEGIYEEKNNSVLKMFLNDFILNLSECIEANATKIKVDFSNLEKSDGKELKGMMNEVAKYFNLELSY